MAIILRLTKKNFEDEEFPHELFLATRQTIKICKANNTSKGIKLSRDQILKSMTAIAKRQSILKILI